MRVEGGEFAYGGKTTGIGGISTGVNTRISGAEIHHNAGAGVGIDVVGGAFVGWSNIYENTYGIHDQSDGMMPNTIIENYLPGSVSQIASVLSPKSGTRIVNNVTNGYGIGTDGVSGTIGAGVARFGNYTDGGVYALGRADVDPGNEGQVAAMVLRYGGVESLRLRRGATADDTVLSIPTGRKVSVLGGTFEMLGTAFKLSATTDVQAPITSVAPASGAAGALPSAPAGYLRIMVNGSTRSLPYY